LSFNWKFYLLLVLFLVSCVFQTLILPVDVTSANKSTAVKGGGGGETGMSIELCCSWDKQISDGILKFKLVNMNEEQSNKVREAFDSWNKQLTTVELVESNSQDQKTEIIVTLGEIDNRNANQLVRNAEAGETAAQSVNNLDRSGYITNARIILSDKIFNTDSDSDDNLYTVVLHEIGHALGLGHANFDDLMNPLISHKDEISVCDVNGVFRTNELIIKKNATAPPPSPLLQTNFSEKNIMDC
jgi:predicted Zn-dependent protease